jgi:hypothetical protein
MTTLALWTPSPVPANRLPNRPSGVSAPILVVAGLLLAAFLLGVGRLRGAPEARRLGYACAGVLLFAFLVAGIAGCGGSGGGGGGSTPHTDSITAVYGGDGTYAGSTSAAVSVSVQ